MNETSDVNVLVYADVAQAVVPRCNLVPDTHLVAMMRQHGVRTIWTHDSDFRRFPQVEVAIRSGR